MASLPRATDLHATAVERRPVLQFTYTGLTYCLMMTFMGVAAINTQANLLFGVFGLMIGVLLITFFVSRKILRKLEVRRQLPDHAVVGRKMTVLYKITNRKRYWPSLSVTVAELDAAEGFTLQPQSYLLHAAPGMTASVPFEVIPKRRGIHHFDRYQVSTSFPFGFIKRALTERRPDGLVCYPPLGQVSREVLDLCAAAEKTGASMRPRRGGADEFYGVKEHRPGENPRLIYWRRSARTAATGMLVAKELTQVAPPRLLLLVDTYAADRSADRHERIERAIAMAASLAAQALDDGLPVGAFVWAGDWKSVEPTRGKRQRNDLLSLLAQLPLNTAHPSTELVSRAARFVKAGTSPVLFTPDERPAGSEDRGRASLLVVPSTSPQAASWFRFGEVDFAACMPADQNPAMARSSAKVG